MDRSFQEIESVEGSPEKNILLDSNLQLVFGVTLLAVIGVASVAPAFPRMMKALQISSADVGLMITVFTLPGVLLSLVFGVMADRYGRKRLLVPSLFLFGLAGGACALTRDFHLLLFFRFWQGVGAAPLMALATTIIGDLYSGKDRTKAMGFNASVINISATGFPAVGGVLATFGWNFPFILPLLALPLGLAVFFWLDNPEPEPSGHLRSQFVKALKSIADFQAITLFTACLATFVVFYATCFTFMPLLLNDRFGASPAVIGLIFAFMSLETAVVASQIGRLAARFSEKTLLKVAFLLYALATFLMPFVPRLWLFLIPMAIYGVGHGINLPCLQSLLAGMAPMAQRATFMSINGMVLRLGQTLGPVLAGLVFALWGTNAVFYCGAGLALSISLLAVVLLPVAKR